MGAGDKSQRIPGPRNGASVSAPRGGGLVLPALQTPYPLGLSRSQDSISGRHHFPEGTCKGLSHASQSMGHASREGCTPIPVRLPEDGSKSCRGGGACGPSRSPVRWACRGGSCGARYLSRAPALGVNSLTHHGGLHRRRSVSPAWQYGP